MNELMLDKETADTASPSNSKDVVMSENEGNKSAKKRLALECHQEGDPEVPADQVPDGNDVRMKEVAPGNSLVQEDDGNRSKDKAKRHKSVGEDSNSANSISAGSGAEHRWEQ